MFGTLLELDSHLSAGDAAVALGTLLLAYFTWRLASKTSEDVEKTQEALDLSRASIESQDMPFVIALPRRSKVVAGGKDIDLANLARETIRIRSEVSGAWLELRLENVGRGPGMVADVRLDVDGELLEPPWRQLPIPAGGAINAAFGFADPIPTGLGEEEAKGTLYIYYSHASGSRYMTSSTVDIRGSYLQCVDYARRQADGHARAVIASE
jgi:hypothetical protein